MALSDRIQRTIEAARRRARGRSRADPNAPFEDDDQGRTQRAVKGTKRAAQTAAAGTKRVVSEAAERRDERVRARRTVEESPGERATQAAQVSPVYDATLDPFGGPNNPEGPGQLMAMAGGLGTPDRGETALAFEGRSGTSDEFDMAAFVTDGVALDDGPVDGLDVDGGLNWEGLR